MEGVQETAGKIAVERKLQDEVGFFLLKINSKYQSDSNEIEYDNNHD